MKGRESGMPDETWWEDFFDPVEVVARLGCIELPGDVVEFGCGYGTFSLPVARKLAGRLHALDIDSSMVERTAERARSEGIGGLVASERDFVAQGTGLPDKAVVHAMLFNILHIEDPVSLLREARRVVTPGGRVSILHWRSDIETPRGPSLEIRPSPEQCILWANQAGFPAARMVSLEGVAPWHFGLVVN